MVNKKQNLRPKPVVLMVLDGWGIANPYTGNAISQANTPNIKNYIVKYPSMVLAASGQGVGLPWGESGNSEVGHLNLGSGRIIYQNLHRIDKSIADGGFYKNKILLKAIEQVKNNNSKLHLLGLVSNGCVHSSIEHLQALIALMAEKEVNEFYVHAILDGRDTPFNSGLNFIKEIEKSLINTGGKIATLSGRFYAMDRDNHWDRTAKSYEAMALGAGEKHESAEKAIEESYGKKIYDEEFMPTVITKDGEPMAKIEDGDAVIFFNYRPDRARQLTKAFVLPGFAKFKREKYLNIFFAGFVEYEKNLPMEIVFPSEVLKNTLGEVLSEAGLKQLRIAETEKYAHVTYFFNGGREIKSTGEDQILVSSPTVSSYDLKPEMSALEITDKVLKAIEQDDYDFILINFANADMVGHTGNLNATIKAIEIVDKCVGKIVNLVLDKGGLLFITADHGNAEELFNMQTGMIDKEHTANPVPLLVVGKEYEGKSLSLPDAPNGDLSLVQPQGVLSDVAPTILKVMGLEKPSEMTGRSLI
ncbi:2,3-bisphosphoglycerate-independent phosphoglycerate mutase [Patescibacteria group bacterium]|nr:2,3-bisphosphoglycerate-independent phosphoglycerate mutase [Patescibacteria group bacterium]MBU1663246.1 2,3-bisphosphoglycerate-independent phosphoglycerate mutase [Patescibacteria group bacterium]MBU2007895.1 2,3-bisphosphoglycerate-independent phosphoglycerate mutase [Patescibacteria group bacterium]MBU2233364.1 2,3-bisphosphoglycerate-independent phosphoglycerate mutase [Patescibacteria group bacterium]MBU2263980.1 2,3-bisphosphoglycerate-independent phosphoglycerate mutase [Patescibact